MMLKKTLLTLIVAMLSVSAFAAQTQTFTIVGQNNLRFSKEHLTVSPGEKVTVKLENKTSLPAMAMSHNWVLLKQGTDDMKFDEAASNAQSNDYIPPSMTDDIIAHTGLVAGGKSDSVTFTAPTKPGDYEYICTFPGHLAAGMKGTLTVKGS